MNKLAVLLLALAVTACGGGGDASNEAQLDAQARVAVRSPQTPPAN